MKNNRAMTLVEVLTSAFVVAVVSIALFSFFIYSARVGRQMDNMNIALNALKSQLSQIETAGYNDIGNYGASSSFNITDSGGRNIPGFSGIINIAALDKSPRDNTGAGIAKSVTLTARYNKASEFPIGDSCGTGCSQISIQVLKLNR